MDQTSIHINRFARNGGRALTLASASESPLMRVAPLNSETAPFVIHNTATATVKTLLWYGHPVARILWWTHALATCVHLALSILILVYFHRAASFPLSLTVYQRVRSSALGDSYVMLPNTYQLGSVNIAALLVCFSFLAFANHAYHLLRGEDGISAQIANERQSIQWLEYFFSASLMIAVIGCECGVLDLGTLLLLAILMATTILFGAVFDDTKNPTHFWFGCIPYACMWLYLWCVFGLAVEQSVDDVPEWIWTIITTLFVTMLFFPVCHYVQHKGLHRSVKLTTPQHDRTDRFARGIFGFQILSLTSKVLLLALTLAYAFRLG
jgi:hypothetical protein